MLLINLINWCFIKKVRNKDREVHQNGIHLILRQPSAFYLLLYNFKLAITPKIEHKLYEIFIDQSSTRELPNNGSSIISARVHKICAIKKKINAIKNNNPILFIVQTYEKFFKKFEIRTLRSTKKKPTHEWVFIYSIIIFFSTVPSS